MASARIEAELARKGQETRIETHQVAIMFGDRGGEIVIGQLARDPAQGLKGMYMAADECFEALAVGELDVHLAAVAFNDGEGIKLSLMAFIIE